MKQVFNSLNQAELFLLRAIIESNQEKINAWLRHFEAYFPPIIGKYLEIISDTLNDPNDKIKLFVGDGSRTAGLIYIKPEQIHSRVLNNPEIKNNVVGEKLETQPNTNRSILIYSSKFHEKFVSSQEIYFPIIKNLSENMDCILAFPKSSPADERHRALCKCIEIDDSNPKKLDVEAISMLNKLKPGIATFLTQNRQLREKLAYSKIIDLLSDGVYVHGSRAPDYAISLGYSRRVRFPNHQPSYPAETKYALPAPELSTKRIYRPRTKYVKKMNNVNIGAFTRLSKLDMCTLEVWAQLLNSINGSTLTFSYLQSNKISEHYTRSFFKAKNISKERIKFMPRMDTNKYLNCMSTLDIVLGASPEQGGITCFDALASAVPYITYDANSTLLSSKAITRDLEMEFFNSGSTSGFIDNVKYFIKEGFPEDPLVHNEKMKSYFRETQIDFTDTTLRALDHIMRHQK